MIRGLLVVALGSFLILFLYLPAAYPPEWFVAQVRIEHGLNEHCWGSPHAARVMERALDLYGHRQSIAPIPGSDGPSLRATPVDGAVATQMNAAVSRLMNNPYFRAVDMLSVLCMFRLSSLAQTLPFAVILAFAVFADGLVRRLVKSKEFVQHSPEAFGTYMCAVIFTACMVALATILPVTVHPFALFSMQLLMVVCLGQALSNHHHRG